MLAYGVVETLAEGLKALAQSARLLAHDFGFAFLAGGGRVYGGFQDWCGFGALGLSGLGFYSSAFRSHRVASNRSAGFGAAPGESKNPGMDHLLHVVVNGRSRGTRLALSQTRTSWRRYKKKTHDKPPLDLEGRGSRFPCSTPKRPR